MKQQQVINNYYFQLSPDEYRRQYEAVHAPPQQISEIHLSKRKGTRIDFIRIVNAMYELGIFTDSTGGKISKKKYFKTLVQC